LLDKIPGRGHSPSWGAEPGSTVFRPDWHGVRRRVARSVFTEFA
jgi:hypothetical protein